MTDTLTNQSIGNELSEHSRQFALEHYRVWRNTIANADRADLEALVMVLIQKRAVDGLNDRRWDAAAHLYFELATVAMLKKVSSVINKLYET